MSDNNEERYYVKVEDIRTGEIVKTLGPMSHRKAVKVESGLAQKCASNYNSFITLES